MFAYHPSRKEQLLNGKCSEYRHESAKYGAILFDVTASTEEFSLAAEDLYYKSCHNCKNRLYNLAGGDCKGLCPEEVDYPKLRERSQ